MSLLDQRHVDMAESVRPLQDLQSHTTRLTLTYIMIPSCIQLVYINFGELPQENSHSLK